MQRSFNEHKFAIQRQTYHIGTRHKPERPSAANRSASQGRIKTFPRPQIPWQFPESLFTPRPHAPPPHTDRRYSANGRSHVLATRLVLLSPAQPCDPRAWRLDQKPRAAREDRRTQVGCSALLCSARASLHGYFRLSSMNSCFPSKACLATASQETIDRWAVLSDRHRLARNADDRLRPV